MKDGVVLDPGVTEREDRDDCRPRQRAADAVAVPVVELEQAALEPAEDPVGPEDVVLRRPLADQHMDLANHLDPDQRQQPPARRRLLTHGVGPAHDRVIRHGSGYHEHEQCTEQDQKLHPVPARQRFAHRRGWLRRLGLIHDPYLR